MALRRTVGVRVAVGALAMAWSFLAACDRVELATGELCSLNSDCESPLICGLERCRRQCVDARDCGAGLSCLLLPDSAEGGVCQLAQESRCALSSDCPDGLVCRFGACTNECQEDRDCPRGSRCESEEGGDRGCRPSVADLCVYNSDCPPPLVCSDDQLCDLECREDRDCLLPRRCRDNLCELPDAG